MACVLCGSAYYHVLRSADDVERESRQRARFVEQRLGHSPSGLEGMDLTQFMHGAPAEIVACAACGAIRRNDKQPACYESDRYDPELMRQLYPRYRDAFALKRDHFQHLLRPGAEVVEVGSHLGAFLEIAECWDWRPIGLDVGRDTSDFARRQGTTVKQVSLEDYSSRRRPEAVFIWNCFEQLDDPWATMIRARSLLSRHGLMVLRVPNADFYRRPLSGSRHPLKAMGYNNLLGFPYLNGYDLAALQRLLASTGFETVGAFATSLLTPPYPVMTERVRKEWHQTRTETEYCGPARSPWIEIVGRTTGDR